MVVNTKCLYKSCREIHFTILKKYLKPLARLFVLLEAVSFTWNKQTIKVINRIIRAIIQILIPFYKLDFQIRIGYFLFIKNVLGGGATGLQSGDFANFDP